MGKVKIDTADKLFSEYIRTRDKWTCQRCFKKYQPPTSALHCSHHHGRGKEATRFDDLNCDALCYGCHMYFTAHPIEHVSWKKERIGEEAYKELQLKANSYCKKDRKTRRQEIQQKLKGLT
jgi:hypothetical protein